MVRYSHFLIRLPLAALLLVAILQLPGCYYMQAMRGHFDLMNQRRPVEEVIADGAESEALRTRLELVQEARDFAVETLALPDNDSYRSYADLGRDYVVWNVFAAPEFSLVAKTWCFPVAGCVAYRGYFDESAARKFADRLAAQGYDTAIHGVAAYSTLGKFDDPVLNTMMHWSDTQLVSTIFHELAHQKLYVKGDTAFNESFATAVANTGIERWLATRDERPDQQAIVARQALRRDVMALVQEARLELEALYESDASDEQKRQSKRLRLDQLSASAASLIQARDPGAGNWLAAPLNNARLVPLGLYEGRQDAFLKILANCNNELTCFYSAAEALAKLSREERDTELSLLAD